VTLTYHLLLIFGMICTFDRQQAKQLHFKIFQRWLATRTPGILREICLWFCAQILPNSAICVQIN